MPESNQLDRLAALTARLGERRRQMEAFRRVVEPLQEGGREAVEGESALLTELEEKLTGAFGLLRALPAGDREALLGELDALLDDVSWELAAELQPDLDAKYKQQIDLLGQVSLDLKTWENRVTELAKVVDGARLEGAPFFALESDLRAVRSALNSIRSALADRLYSGLPTLCESGKKTITQLEDSVAKSENQVNRVKKLVKQADLLIMQVGLAEGDYEYRVLLRSADRFQTRGINIIQDVRRLSKADRDWMITQLSQLTTSMNQSLRAAHAAAHPAPPDTPRTITPADQTSDGTSQSTTKDTLDRLERLGGFMFKMVIPDQMQRYLKGEKWSFSITTNDLELPWELICFDGPDTEVGTNLRFLCLEQSISRMPLGGVFPPPPPRRAAGPPRKRRMLLIHSDPNGNLTAAASEVDTIARELASELEVERVNPAEATNERINDILMGQSFDFLHYAGHAYFDTKNPNQSGLQLKDSFLTAEKIRLLNKGGSLIFLNACESGTVAHDSDPQRVLYLLHNPEPVVGLASAFVYSGAFGCVGSLWPVYDKPAADLAVRFYRFILSGEPTGEALRRARAEIRTEYPREITWAGYVLYGDPTFRLTEI